MGVRVIEHDEAEPAEAATPNFCNIKNDYACCCAGGASDTTGASSSNLSPVSTTTTTTTAATTTTTTYTTNNHNNITYHETKTQYLNNATAAAVGIKSLAKDVIGNSKEFRVEHNKCDLRIIGNNNRIRIGLNAGNVQIIGNNTKLKVINNQGHIKYSGNDGRILLGNDSSQQMVDYVGCNGTLKVIDSTELSISSNQARLNKKAKSTNNKNVSSNNDKASSLPQKLPAPTQSQATSQSQSTSPKSPKYVKTKSASYGGDGDSKSGGQWQKFNEMFQRQSWHKFANLSLPNLKENYNNSDNCKSSKCSKDYIKNNKVSNGKSCNISNNINIINNLGNISIKNSVNVTV